MSTAVTRFRASKDFKIKSKINPKEIVIEENIFVKIKLKENDRAKKSGTKKEKI